MKNDGKRLFLVMSALFSSIDPASGMMTVFRGGEDGTAEKAVHPFLRGDADGTAVGGSTQIGDPFGESPWVHAAVNHVAGPIGQARLQLLDASSEEPIDDANLRAFWQQPAANVGPDGFAISRAELVETTVALRRVYGQAFWILDESWEYRSTQKSPILLAGPRQMTPLYGAGGQLAGWRYIGPRGWSENFPVHQVLNLKMKNPACPESPIGVSPWESARVHAETEAASASFAKRLMDRNGESDPYLINKTGGMLSDEQILQMKSQWRRRVQAARNGKRDITLWSADVEMVTPKIESQDASFVAARLGDREAIFIAFGVPASMAQKMESYSIGSASDIHFLVVNTCMPEAAQIARYFAHVSELFLGYRSLGEEVMPSRRFAERRIVAQFDFSNHPAVSAAREEKFEIAKELHDRGMSWDVINDTLGLGLEPFEGSDVGFVALSRVPVREVLAMDRDDNEPEEKTAPEDELRKLLENRATAKADDERARRWARIDRGRTQWRKQFEKQFSKVLFEARRETLKNLEAELGKAAAGGAPLTKGALEIIFDLDRFTTGIVAVFRKVREALFGKAGKELFEEIGQPDLEPEYLGGDEMARFFKARENLTRDLTQEVWEEVLTDVEEGIREGESLEKMADRIRSRFQQINKVRARRIALTESTAAHETSRYLAMKQAGITHKDWLSGGDDRVRHTHRAVDGVVIPIGESWKVGAAHLMFPGDSVGGQDHPEEVINCRCVLGAAQDPNR